MRRDLALNPLKTDLTMTRRSDQTANPTRRQIDAAMRLFGPREGTNMRTKVIHDRLDRAGRNRDEEPIADIIERAAMEASREPIDDLDPPAVLPDHAESEEVGDVK